MLHLQALLCPLQALCAMLHQKWCWHVLQTSVSACTPRRCFAMVLQAVIHRVTIYFSSCMDPSCTGIFCDALERDCNQAHAQLCTNVHQRAAKPCAWRWQQLTFAFELQDVWSLAVTVYETITGALPLHVTAAQCEQMAHGNAQYPWESAEHPAPFADSRIKALVLASLARVPSQRPSAADVMKTIASMSM